MKKHPECEHCQHDDNPQDRPCLDCGATVGNYIHQPAERCGTLYGCTVTPNHQSSDHHEAKTQDGSNQ